MSYNVRDADFIETKALPNGANTIYTDGIDLGALNDNGARLADCEVLISAPALATAELPDTKTMTYSIQSDDDSAFGSATELAPSVLVQTGAGGAGAAAATFRFRVPTDCERYIRLKAVNSGTGDASGKDVTFELLF